MSERTSHPSDDDVLAAGLRLAVDANSAIVAEALVRAGIDCLLLKGPVLEQLLYEPGEGRSRGDSDLLVPIGRFKDAEAVLASEGFELVLDDAVAPEWERHGSTWSRRDPPGVVDLHWRLPGVTADPDRAWPALRDGARPFPIGGVELAAPGLGACAMHLALHVAQHGPRDDKAADDLGRGLARLDRAVWREAAELAHELGAVAAFAVGLRSTREGSALADDLGVDARPDPVDALRAARAPGGAHGLERLARTPGARARARVIASTLVPPAEFMRYYKPLARRGRLGLVAAYAVRPLDLGRQVPEAWRAWRSARQMP